MTFDTEKAKIGREPFYVVKIYLTSCDNTFSVSPCNATGEPCFNAFGNCRDVVNFAETTKIYTFSSSREKLPMMDFYPFIIDMGIIAGKRDPGKSLGKRDSAQILLRDMPHHDRGIDPYVSQRSYDPMDQGTFWTKLLARNKYYTGKKCEVYVGYLTDDMSDLSNFEKYTYFIDRIDCNNDNTVTLTVIDIFKLSDRATYPAEAYSELAAPLLASGNTAALVDASSYPSSGHVRFNNDICSYSSKSGNDLTGIVHGQYGSEAADHATGDSAQQCHVGVNEDCIDTIKTILEACDIDSSYIPYADWQTEFSAWLGDYTLNYLLSKPEKGSKLINEIIEQCMLNMWWDAKDSEIKLDAFIPVLPTSAVTITQDVMLKDSFDYKDRPDDKLSQYAMVYDLRDYSDKVEFENCTSLYFSLSDNSDPLKDGEIRPKQVISRWFDETNEAAARTTANRALNQKLENPKLIKFKMDIRHEQPGTDFLLQNPKFVDDFGATKTIPVTIISAKQEVLGTTMSYEAISTGAVAQRYGVIAPNTMGLYTVESDANRQKYVFISQNSEPFFADGTEAYKIL